MTRRLSSTLFLLEFAYRPRFDDTNPAYDSIVSRLAEVRQALESGDYKTKHNLDLVSLNGGNWTTACVFGGYNAPLADMLELGARVSLEDEESLRDRGERSFPFRLSQVEEFEIMIAYVDSANDAHFIHFNEGVGSAGQHFKQCIFKPDTLLELP